jgi:uncharacterized protein
MMSKGTFLLDVNVLYALSAPNHIHHQAVSEWFYASKKLQWSICAFTEAGFLRISSRTGQYSIREATTILAELKKHPGYRYISIAADWETLCGRFFKRLYGTKQITDAYLLGLAVEENLVLVTLDRGIVYLAGEEFAKYVHLLQHE